MIQYNLNENIQYKVYELHFSISSDIIYHLKSNKDILEINLGAQVLEH